MMKFKKIAAIALAVVMAFGMAVLAACSPGTVEEPERSVSSISVTTPPAKTEYVAGESFDETGMVVTAAYSDGTSEAVTGYTVDKTTLSVGDTSVTISYEGKTCIQEITVTEAAAAVLLVLTDANTGGTLNLYADNTLILDEGGAYPTTFEWVFNEDKGLIEVTIPAGMEAYVTIDSYLSGGMYHLDVTQAYGAPMNYSCSFEEYSEAFGVQAREVGRVSAGADYFAILNDGSYTMSVGGEQTAGYVEYTTEYEYTTQTSSGPMTEMVPALILMPEGAESEEYIEAPAPYSVFTIAVGDTTFNLPESRYLHWMGNTVCGYANEGGDLEIYFYPDSTAAIVVTDKAGNITEYGYKYTTFAYDKTDPEEPLKINCAATSNLTITYDDDEYEYTFKFVEQTLDMENSDFTTTPPTIVYKEGDTHTLTVNAAEINRLLADFAPAQELAAYTATSATKADGSAAAASAFTIIFYKGGALSIMLNSGYSESILGEGQWQASADGIGGMFSGSYVEFGFFGNDGADSMTITVTTSGIQSASEIVFAFDEDAYAALYAALTEASA